MNKNKILQKDYTLSSLYYQIKLPLDLEILIPADDPVRLLSAFVEGMELSDLYKTYGKIKKNQASPRQLFKIIIYASMNRIYSSRDIETACHRDINFMYLLEGKPVPDHATIARFISLHFSKCSKNTLAEVSDILLEIGEISGKSVFIDGTKLESVANKYTFVWKKSVSKNEIKLGEAIKLFIKSISKYNNIFTDYEEAVILQDVYNWFNYNLKVKLPDSAVTDYAYFMQEKNTDDILRFFKDFDLSISNYDFIECPKDRIAGRLPKEVFDDLISRIEKDLLNGDDIESNRVLFGLNDDFFVAKYLDEQVQFETIQFYHENTNVPFHMYEESDGTKKIFKLLEILFQEDDDIVYIVDEIDRCLHPLLTYNFINAFLEKVKTKNCQLIISTQESLLLDFKILRKDEIWFVSKENGHSILSKLDPTKDRADKKLVKAYLEGDKGTPKIINNVYKYS